MSFQEPRTRIQIKNHRAILDAALEVFSQLGFGAATLDQIAKQAGMSKPNLLYYFPSKEAIYLRLLSELLETWLDPLKEIDPAGDPHDEIRKYVRGKLSMSREYPRESRLFAHEIMQGAPHLLEKLQSDLRQMVDEKTAVIDAWIAQGKIAPLDAHHLIFSIWSMTQHYADFAVQVSAVLGPDRDAFAEAEAHLDAVFGRMLRV
ncbi:MAG: TetR family transcriptional regulator C-terminal domain-containing protein [Pseudomonadota bacterium]